MPFNIKQDAASELTELVQNKGKHQDIVKALAKFVGGIHDGFLPTLVNWHPLGFLQFKINRSADGVSTKLHIWDDQIRSVQNPAWLVHRHEWDLSSHILVGRVNNKIYEVSRAIFSQESGKQVLYKVTFDGQYSKLHKTAESVTIKLLSDTDYGKAGKYDIGVNEYHCTTVGDNELASTIAVSEHQVQDAPFVVGDSQGLNEYCYHRALCPEQVWRPILDKLLLKLMAEPCE